jgi:nitrite reductase/ring-hydroxylating ferredoxin subunit
MCPADPPGDTDLGLLEDLPDPCAREVRVGAGDWPLRIVLVRVGERVHAYQNRCPHAGHPLNLRPDDFLTPDGRLLICRSHGALFERETGRCVEGPCAGAALRRLPLALVDGRLRLACGAVAD